MNMTIQEVQQKRSMKTSEQMTGEKMVIAKSASFTRDDDLETNDEIKEI